MNRDEVLAHVRRYPRWYLAGVVWMLMLVALPVVELDPLEVFSEPTPAQQVDAPAPDGEPTTSAPSSSASAADTTPAAPSPAVPAPATPPIATPETPPLEEVPPEELEPDPLDQVFDLVPVPQVPAAPEELEGVARAVAPVAQYGCSGIGLAGIVVAVVAPTTEGVPLERILPYLAPATSACASFPIPDQYTVCAADEPFVTDIGGLTRSPPILGLGIDQLEAIETMMSETFGQAIPRVAPTLRETLDCRLVTE